MPLRGDLKSINLANVLQDLASNELTGTLTIQAADRKRHFWFEKGRLRLVGLGQGKGPSPLNGLLALGKIQAADIVAPSKKAQGRTIVRSMMKKGAVNTDSVKAALEHQMSELVCDAFVWSEASFEFVEGDPDEDAFDAGQLDWEIRMATDPIIMEALRRVDEWGEIRKSVMSLDEILVRVADRPVPAGDALVERIAGMLDGERSLRDVMDQTQLGQFNVFRAIAALLRGGVVRILTVKEAADRARAVAKKQPEQSLRLARFGLEREPNNVELRTMAAEILETLERPVEAASEYRQLAAAQVEHKEQREAAVATYRKVLALAPRDTFAHERLFQLLLELGKKAEALQQGEAMATAYKRAGLPDKAREVYARLIAALGDDDDLLESAAELARHLGDKKDAIGLYRKLFDRALARGDEDAVIQLSRTMLRLDPSLEDIARRRMEIETGVYRKRQSRRRRFKLWMAVGALLIAAGVAVSHEIQARRALAEVRESERKLLPEKQYASILRNYNSFLEDFPWSLVTSDTREHRNQLEEDYANRLLPTLQDVEEARLFGSLTTAQELRWLAKLKPTQERAEEVLARLRRQRGAIENRYIQELAALARQGTPECLERIRKMDHPLAFQALQDLLRGESEPVRLAAVTALGNNASLESLEVQINVLRDPAVRDVAEANLRKLTGQNFGGNQDRWLEWFRKTRVQPGRQPLHAMLPMASSRLPAVGKIPVEWRLANLGSNDAEFSFVGEFEVRAPGGAKLAAGKGPPGGGRRILLRPGEHIGGSADMRDHVAGLDKPGSYRVKWIARVNWGGSEEMAVQSLETVLELVAEEPQEPPKKNP